MFILQKAIYLKLLVLLKSEHSLGEIEFLYSILRSMLIPYTPKITYL